MAFEMIKNLSALKKIKSGKTADVSYSMIVENVISLPTANKNLSKDDYLKVYDIYKEFKDFKTPVKVDYVGWATMAQEIIDKIEEAGLSYSSVYSGNVNEWEHTYNNSTIKSPSKKFQEFNENMLNRKLEEYAFDVHLNGKAYRVNYEDALTFVKTVIHEKDVNGKKSSIENFERFREHLIEKDRTSAFQKATYFLGVMKSNKIINSSEMQIYADKYEKEEENYTPPKEELDNLIIGMATVKMRWNDILDIFDENLGGIIKNATFYPDTKSGYLYLMLSNQKDLSLLNDDVHYRHIKRVFETVSKKEVRLRIVKK